MKYNTIPVKHALLYNIQYTDIIAQLNCLAFKTCSVLM